MAGAIAYTVMLFGFLGVAITLFWGLRAFKVI